MSNLDLDAMTLRFRQRAEAVRERTMPPVAGAARLAFLAQAKVDFQDFASGGDAEANLDNGILTLRVDLRPS